MAVTSIPNKRFCAKPVDVRRALEVSANAVNKHLEVISSGKGELRDLRSNKGVLVYKTNSGGWWVARSKDPKALADFIDSVNTLRKFRDTILKTA